jgi:hypothetical protein
MEILLVLLMFLVVITGVGHGIWALLAAIFRAFFGEPESKPVELKIRCVACGVNLQTSDDFCPVCGSHQKKSQDTSPLADLAMTVRQLDRFLNQGQIDAVTHRNVMKAIEEERERLTGPRRPAPAVETPPPQPEPVKPEPVIKPAAPPPAMELQPAFSLAGSRVDAMIRQEPKPAIPATPVKAEPRRTFTEMLETFMEESSIRWGELIGGLLIIGCSLALVISLWSQITAVPLLKFSVFVGMTAGLFGMGFYSAHRWKLPTTSRGALIISTLLVPLNFLAMTAFSQSAGANSPIILGGEVLALGLFLFLVYQAGQVVTPGKAWLLAGATLAPSFAMLMAKHWPVAHGPILFLGIAPLLAYWMSTGVLLRGVKESEEDDEDESDRIFVLFGIASFAVMLSVGLLLIKSGNLANSRNVFAPLIALLGVPAIATGLTLRRAKAGKTQTLATSVAILGAMLALTGLVLAWPEAGAVIAVALILCAVCVGIAWRFDLKLAHALALLFFALAYLTSANVLAGNYPSWSEDGVRLAASFLTNTSGLSWLSLFALFGAAAETWRRFERRPESRLYEFATGCAAFFSLLILTWHGFGRAGDPGELALVYFFYAAAALAVAWYRNQFVASWIGLFLALLALIQAFVFKFGYALAPHHPTRLSLLVYASLTTVAAVALRNSGEKGTRIFSRPLTLAALFSSVTVAPILLLGGWMTVGQLSVRLFWLAGIWLVLSVAKHWAVLFTAFQAALTVGLVCGVAAIFDSRALPSQSLWLDPHVLQAHGIALALLSLAWLLLRLAVQRFSGRSNGLALNLLYPGWPTVDRVVTVVAWGVLSALSISSGISIGDSAVRARGFGSWLLLTALLAVFAVSLWERFSKRAVLAMMTLLGCACLLLAGELQGNTWPWSPLRSLLAIGFAVAAAPILFRKQLQQACAKFHWPQMPENANGLASLSRAASIALFALPVLALMALSFLAKWLVGHFSFVETVVFLVPLFILSLTLAAHAIRERSSAYAFSSGLMLNLAATLGFLLVPDVRLITVLQANVIVTAIFSLAWLVVWRRIVSAGQTSVCPDDQNRLKSVLPSTILQAQIVVTLCTGLSLLAISDLRMILLPQVSSAMAASMGSGWGWLAVVLPAIAWLGLRGWRLEKLRVEHLAVALLAIVSLIACSFSRFASGWATYHALMIGIAVSGWLMLLFRWKREALFGRFSWFEAEAGGTSVVWATSLGLVQLGLMLRGLEAPNDVYWTAGSGASLCLFFTGLAMVASHRGYIYLAGALCTLVVSRFLIWGDDAQFSYRKVVLGNVIALCLTSLVWLKLDLAVVRRGTSRNIYPFHCAAARFAMLMIELVTVFRWMLNLFEFEWGNSLDWLALASVATLLVACLWDEETDLSWRGLYGIGLLAIAQTFAGLHLDGLSLQSFTAASFALFALAATLLWRYPGILTWLTEKLRLPRHFGLHERIANWFVNTNVTLAFLITFWNLLIICTFPSLNLRLLVATAAFAFPIAFALLVRGENSVRLITRSLQLTMLNLVLWSWAWLPAENGWQLINRLVIVMLIAEAVLIGYRLVVVRQLPGESEWRKSLQADLPVIAAVGGMSLAFVLVTEVSNYASFGTALMTWPVILAVLGTLICLCLIGLAFAILPGEDPFGLDERGRMRYVYAVEACIVLTLMHVRVTMPWLFGGRFTAYWPLLVMLVAFVGIGLSELFRRQGKLVLAEPLERTGVLLPLLPVIGFWALDSQVSYSMLLLLAGLFYGWLSVLRHSFGFGLLAALAGNGGLWHFLHGVDGYGLSEHPQLWLIPVSLSVLLAARINRDSLSQEQHSSIRYGALIVIYVSSTADIFLNGVDDSPWLPIVLSVLSVGGVIAGLMLRVRSFLFLGTAFLLLSMLTMIWSASVNLRWTWLWYVTGIALGVFILYSFAMFERRREEMLRFVERLKQWQ